MAICKIDRSSVLRVLARFPYCPLLVGLILYSLCLLGQGIYRMYPFEHILDQCAYVQLDMHTIMACLNLLESFEA